MKMNIEGTISHIEKRLDAHDSAFDSLAERNVEAEIENILDRLAVRMYDEGQLDKPSLMGRQVAIVKINEAKAQLTAIIDTATREAYKEGYILGGIDVLTKQETARTVQMAKDIEKNNGKRD